MVKQQIKIMNTFPFHPTPINCLNGLLSAAYYLWLSTTQLIVCVTTETVRRRLQSVGALLVEGAKILLLAAKLPVKLPGRAR